MQKKTSYKIFCGAYTIFYEGQILEQFNQITVSVKYLTFEPLTLKEAKRVMVG